jgi:hypothetical protein
MTEFNDFVLVVSRPGLLENCRGFAGVGMPHCRVPGRSQRFLRRFGLGWLARCLFCETPTPQ